MPDLEIAETFAQIHRILDPSQTVKHGDAKLLACAIMRNAASPTHIDQGGHNTCNVTTLECRLYTRTPSVPARLVADVAIHGQFTTHDGTVVSPRNLAPDAESLRDPTPDGERNWASQVFQITTVNIYWNRKDTLYGGKFAGKGNIHYIQDTDGEYLLNTSKNPPERHSFRTIDASHPNLELDALSDISEQITGRPAENLAITRSFTSGEAAGITSVSSVQGFKDTLHRFKRIDAFPVILLVDAAKKPIGDGSSDAFGPHVVTVTDYDPATGMLTVDNQWGLASDMTGLQGEKPKVSAEQMYDAMRMYPGPAYIWDFFKRSVKDTTAQDVMHGGVSGVTMRGLYMGAFGNGPQLARSGLSGLSRLGMPGASSALSATETRLGSRMLRGGTALTALGTAVMVHDLRTAFNEGPAYGCGTLTRIAGASVGFESGAKLTTGLCNLTRLKWAPGRAGLIIAGGLTAATVIDRFAGEPLQIAGSLAYEKVRDLWR